MLPSIYIYISRLFLRWIGAKSITKLDGVVSDYDVRHMYERLYDIYDIYMGLDRDVKSNGGH